MPLKLMAQQERLFLMAQYQQRTASMVRMPGMYDIDLLQDLRLYNLSSTPVMLEGVELYGRGVDETTFGPLVTQLPDVHVLKSGEDTSVFSPAVLHALHQGESDSVADSTFHQAVQGLAVRLRVKFVSEPFHMDVAFQTIRMILHNESSRGYAESHLMLVTDLGS